MNARELRDGLRAGAEGWWRARNARERLILVIGGALAGVAFSYVLLWEPVMERSARLEAEVGELRGELAWMRSAAETVEAGGGAEGGEPVVDERSLLGLVNRTARAVDLESRLQRVQPDGERRVRVWLDQAPAPAVMRWLDDIEGESGVRVEVLRLERGREDGIVNARLTLEVI